VQFICSAIQAASREGFEQSSKLCVQYLAPIIKNRQYNYLPIGGNPFVGASARPNELTYSEDWLRPDAAPVPGTPTATAPPAEAVQVTSADPGQGLPGLMLPAEGPP
jgi:phospholipid/cholesterol/gamma-HCH transport system substrate-binding protein